MTSPYLAAQLQARQIAEQTGLSMAEIVGLPLSEFARLSGRPTPVAAALAAVRSQDAAADSPPPTAPRSAPQPPESEPAGLDPDSPEFFMAWRANRVSSGEGIGIFSGMGSQSEEFKVGARRHAGRTGLAGNRNVTEAPRLEGRYLNHDARVDRRSASERFSAPGNAFGI